MPGAILRIEATHATGIHQVPNCEVRRIPNAHMFFTSKGNHAEPPSLLVRGKFSCTCS